MSVECKRQVKDSVISCSHINKSFINLHGEEHLVIDDISLEVENNEFLVLFGPGQCGKTTMINIISGLDLPSEGEVIVNGKKSNGPWSGQRCRISDHFPVSVAHNNGECRVRT